MTLFKNTFLVSFFLKCDQFFYIVLQSLFIFMGPLPP